MDEVRITGVEQIGNNEAVSFATIGEVYEDGVTLIFDGTEEATEKRYKCNTSVFFEAGDRVKLEQDSGTFVVAYPIGAPKRTREVGIPPGGVAGRVLGKRSSTDYDVEWTEVSAEKLSYGPSYDSYELALGSGGVITPTYSSNKKIHLGTSSKPLGEIQSENVNANGSHLYGEVNIGATKSGTTAKLGFFGKTPIARQTLSSSATLAQVITALKNYGLFN